MQAGDDLAKICRDIPEEFWADFDAICAILTRRLDAVTESAERAAASIAHLSDKEVGLRLNEFPADIRGLIFSLRKQKDSLLSGRSRQVIFRSIRPTANELPGYVAVDVIDFALLGLAVGAALRMDLVVLQPDTGASYDAPLPRPCTHPL